MGVLNGVKYVFSQFLIGFTVKNLVYTISEDITENFFPIGIHTAANNIPVGEYTNLPENLRANKTHAAPLWK